MKYFSYGMNTNVNEMAYRCPNAKSLGHAKLLEHKFRFAGPADVIQHPGSIVHGVLWDITPDCLEALDFLEGYPNYYYREYRKVQYNNQVIDALVYYMLPGRNERSPSSGYFKCLQDGYRAHHVPTKQINKAAVRAKKSNTFYYS